VKVAGSLVCFWSSGDGGGVSARLDKLEANNCRSSAESEPRLLSVGELLLCVGASGFAGGDVVSFLTFLVDSKLLKSSGWQAESEEQSQTHEPKMSMT